MTELDEADYALDCNGRRVPENEAPLDKLERHLGYVKESVGELDHRTPVHRALGHLWYAVEAVHKQLRTLQAGPVEAKGAPDFTRYGPGSQVAAGSTVVDLPNTEPLRVEIPEPTITQTQALILVQRCANNVGAEPGARLGFYDAWNEITGSKNPPTGGEATDDDEFAARHFWLEWANCAGDNFKLDEASDWPEEVAFFRRVIQHGRDAERTGRVDSSGGKGGEAEDDGPRAMWNEFGCEAGEWEDLPKATKNMWREYFAFVFRYRPATPSPEAPAPEEWKALEFMVANPNALTSYKMCDLAREGLRKLKAMAGKAAGGK